MFVVKGGRLLVLNAVAEVWVFSISVFHSFKSCWVSSMIVVYICPAGGQRVRAYLQNVKFVVRLHTSSSHSQYKFGQSLPVVPVTGLCDLDLGSEVSFTWPHEGGSCDLGL